MNKVLTSLIVSCVLSIAAVAQAEEEFTPIPAPIQINVPANQCVKIVGTESAFRFAVTKPTYVYVMMYGAATDEDDALPANWEMRTPVFSRVIPGQPIQQPIELSEFDAKWGYVQLTQGGEYELTFIGRAFYGRKGITGIALGDAFTAPRC